MKRKHRKTLDEMRASIKPLIRSHKRKPQTPQIRPNLNKSYFDIHPSVLQATCDELIQAGWGSWEANQIPEDWATRRPRAVRRVSGHQSARRPARWICSGVDAGFPV